MTSCLMATADASQRGHTCWFDTIILAVANSKTSREIHKKSIFAKLQGSDLSDEILSKAGKHSSGDKLHDTISSALGGDVCPRKPVEGHNALKFLNGLLSLLDVGYVILSTTAVSNTSEKISEVGPCRTHIFNLEDYIKTKGLSKIRASQVETGVCAVQVVSPISGCAKIVLTSDTIDIGLHEKYQLTLRNIIVSSKGHVITYGTCDNPNEWFIYDNELVGKGVPPRKVSSLTFESVVDQIFHFPHTFFSLKMGTVTMNPFFLDGPQSGATFMYDIRSIKN